MVVVELVVEREGGRWVLGSGCDSGGGIGGGWGVVMVVIEND